MISGKLRSTIKHAHVRREGVMSEMGHSLPMHTSSVSSNVRYASDTDHSGHKSELTRCANRRH